MTTVVMIINVSCLKGLSMTTVVMVINVYV